MSNPRVRSALGACVDGVVDIPHTSSTPCQKKKKKKKRREKEEEKKEEKKREKSVGRWCTEDAHIKSPLLKTKKQKVKKKQQHKSKTRQKRIHKIDVFEEVNRASKAM